MSPIARILNLVLSIFQVILLIRILLSWIMPHARYSYNKNEILDLIYKITDPVLEKVKLIVPLGRMAIDLGPMLILIGIEILRGLVIKYL